MRRLLTPGWLIAHAVVVAIAITFIGLGSWQLRRLDERRAFNETLLARGSMTVLPVTDALADDGDEAAYRRVTARGRYDTSNELILLSRARLGIAGHHVVTPLVLQDGRALLVDRGWVPFALDEPPVREAVPPAGEVELAGRLLPSQERGRFGPVEEPGARLTQIFRIDVDRVREQLPFELLPLWLQLSEQQPAQPGRFPIPTEIPPLSEGPHLAYAVQWFLFTAIGLTGYPLLLRQRLRAARRRERAAVMKGSASATG